jgi:manganese/zinc/iron transport system permease protein
MRKEKAMSPSFEIQLIAVIVAVACALPGNFLVLRKMSMMSDSITHTILLGIVIGFFITYDLSSPLLIIGAALIGLVTVWLTESLNRTKLLSEDASIGIVFPLLFSIAIILITRYAGSVHLDTDSVLLGELAFAPFNRLVIGGVDMGAKDIYTTGALLIINLAVIVIFFKELKIVTFDPALAAALGFAPILVHYILMGMVSLTTVGAFSAVGSILVVAFMVGPPVSAYLLTDNLKVMLVVSGLIGAFNGIVGYQFARILDVSIAGSMAVMTGVSFLIVFIYAPKRGLISSLKRRQFQRVEFRKKMMLFHIINHEGDANEKQEIGLYTIHKHLDWDRAFAEQMIMLLQKEGQIYIKDEVLHMTEQGKKDSQEDYRRLFV